MPNAEQRIQQAQTDLETLRANTQKIHKFLTWAQEATDHADSFCDYYTGQWMDDRAAENVSDVEVTGEDEPYDAITEFESALRQLARTSVGLVTREG